jgi:hypothetical protein
VVVADVKEAVAFEPEGLVYLEIKTDCFHCWFWRLDVGG